MKKIQFLGWVTASFLLLPSCGSGTGGHGRQASADSAAVADNPIVTGADRTEEYVPYLMGKRVGLAINNTSVIGDKLSMDSLIALGVNVVKGFGPEHGFRGNASAGAKIVDEVDEKTDVPLISLFGGKYKPTAADLDGVDVMVFDMQDVGVRFYTYVSTLHYIMEACAENDIEVVILDRPNPNDGYVDGPVLEKGFESFVGMHPIPIAHGLTFGEYAGMINGQRWLADGVQCKIKVIPMLNYHHGKPYTLPIPPSPNLNTQQAILLYPATCLFEGTEISEGRGTMFAFSVVGSPKLEGKFDFSFTPVSIPGMSEKPKHLGETCYGLDLREVDTDSFKTSGRINLSWLRELYEAHPDKDNFFRGSFSRLAGNDKLEQQIRNGISDEEIHQSWEPALGEFKQMREQYLIYD
ncbi:MAG TPA: DUF1343 domain-containing protein [Parapedobacter sp.]|uniref:exo-beta-N-acetylmuramidase NamZ family protein n=1 Tax=Parapedobacter sp. TaxID=1958893 RepID=UPI002B567921|nr:DUF1343 domain-containing protein [Parapedobacter sp.]HWK57263.1 DUF1343 domain-containing protein [Parapedobacter sp.]